MDVQQILANNSTRYRYSKITQNSGNNRVGLLRRIGGSDSILVGTLKFSFYNLCFVFGWLFGIDVAHKYDKILQVVVLIIYKIRLVIFCHTLKIFKIPRRIRTYECVYIRFCMTLSYLCKNTLIFGEKA